MLSVAGKGDTEGVGGEEKRDELHRRKHEKKKATRFSRIIPQQKGFVKPATKKKQVLHRRVEGVKE